MRKLLLGTVAALGLIPTSVIAGERCSSEEFQESIKQMYADGPVGKRGLKIIDFEDEQETPELPANYNGKIRLSCKANILISTGEYKHMLYNVEEHANGKIFSGYQIFDGKYAVARPRPLIPETATLPPMPHYTTLTPPVIGTPEATPTSSPMFLKGVADRTAWETYEGGLAGDYRMGAEYWASQRSLQHPGSCEQDSPEFTAGCKGAKLRLTPTDYLRKSNAEYKAGWNSYGH